jgi:hypothetical protein
MASAKPKLDQTFTQALVEFDDTETCLGELAAYLSDIADELSHDPEGLDRALSNEWPDLNALLQLRAKWIERRDALIIAWRDLELARRVLHSLPRFGAVDRSRAVL